MAKRKSTRRTARKPASKKSPDMTIQRGGELLSVEKSKDAFVVKRTPTQAGTELLAATRNPDMFPGLKHDERASAKGVELYHVQAASLDKAMAELRANSPDVIWCSHVYHMPGDPNGLMMPYDDIYIELKEGYDEAKINKLLVDHALELIPEDEESPHIFRVRLTTQSKENPIKIANKLRGSGEIVLAEPNFAVAGTLHIHRPTDDLFHLQWHLENEGGVGLTAGVDVNATRAWDISRGSRDVAVAVIDDGFDTGHPDFSSQGKIRSPRDFGQGDTDPSPHAGDNHGTACAGVAVADENGAGVVGLAPECGLMPIRWSGSVSDQDIKEQFDHPRLKGADVISCSWGVVSNVFTLSTSMKRTISRAATEGRGGKGCVIVFAAGNDNHDIDNLPHSRDGFAIHPDVIAVAASNSRDKQSHYSNFGDAIWVCAPSSGAGGLGIVTTDVRGSRGYQPGDYTTRERFGGTSSSTPLVAGLCALLLSVNPDLTARQVKEILKKTAVPIDPAGGNYDANGHSRIYGWGRIDAFAAVTEASGNAIDPGLRIVSFESNPNLPIPDDNPVGVADTIQVRDSAAVHSVEVDVDIKHTYRGDLKIELVAPDGAAIVLFGRSAPQGDSGDDLLATFTADNVAALTQFRGKPIAGNWSLRVSDLAAIDFGTLRRWTLRLGIKRQSEWEVAPGTRIPDNNATGISSAIEVAAGGTLKAIAVTVDISHTYRGDLRVEIESPNGTVVKLKSVNNRDGVDDLKQTFRLVDTPALRAFLDQPIQGRWRLHVSDNLSQDAGKLNRWGLQLLT